MPQPDIIQTILKDSNYRLDLFDEDEIQTVRERISIKQQEVKRPRNPMPYLRFTRVTKTISEIPTMKFSYLCRESVVLPLTARLPEPFSFRFLLILEKASRSGGRSYRNSGQPSAVSGQQESGFGDPSYRRTKCP